MITLEMQTKFSAGRQTHSCRILFGTNADRANMEQAVGMQPAVGWNLQTRDRAMRSKDSEGFVKRKSASESLALRHAGVLGLSSLIQFEPFSVLEWMPALLERLAVHTSDPEPIKTSALLFFSQFWTTHRDSWNLYTAMFNPALLDTLTELFRGHRSYYL